MIEISPTSIGRFVIATGAAVGWLMTGSAPQEAPDVRGSQPSIAQPADVGPPVQFMEVLRDRMREPVAPQRGRNPFTYGGRHAAPAVAAAPAVVMPEAPPPPAEPPPPVFKLSGIAADHQDGILHLTGIVMDNGVMVFAKRGDVLSNGYSVVGIDEASITLIDAAGVTLTLRLP